MEDGPLSVEEILRIGSQAAAGLAAAHRQGLVHRDVKPANILLENSMERAVLTDFGLARAIDDASLTRTGILAGTPHYMSPEQACGDDIDHRSDLFSLGAVLYFMATGHPPFRGSTALGVLHRICRDAHRPVWQVNNNIPDELSDVIDRLLAKKPAQRFASAEEVQEELASLLSRLQREGLGRRRFRAWRRLSRRKKLVFAAVAVVLCAAITTGIWVATSPRAAITHPASSTSAKDVRQLTELESQYTNELSAARGQLDSSAETSSYLRVGDDAWRREIQNVERALKNLESFHDKPLN
jgi:serine/threonine protein kinase